MDLNILKKINKDEKIQYVYKCLAIETRYRVGLNMVWLIALIFIVISITLFMLQLYGATISMVLVGLAVCLIVGLINKVFTNMLKEKLDIEYKGGR